MVEGAAVAVHLSSSSALDESRGVSCSKDIPFLVADEDGDKETWARVSLLPRLWTMVTSKSTHRLKLAAIMSSTVMSLAPPVTVISSSTMLSIIRVVWFVAITPPSMGIACTMRSTCSIDDTFQDGLSGISRPGVEMVTGIARVSPGSRTSVIVTGECMFQNGTASVAPTSI